MLSLFLLSHAFADTVSLGDRLWCQGEYNEAANTWKEASRSDNPATVAQSHYRRLLTASNLGWATVY